MFPRLLGLVVLVLVSMLPLNFAFRMVSAQSDVQVFVGLVVLLALVIGWYFVGRNYIKYFLQRIDTMKSASDKSGFGRMMMVFVLVGSAMLSTACGRTVIEPGHVGIVVNSYGQDRGVESYPRVTGVTWYNPFTTSVLEYPTFVQNAVWTHSLDEGKAVNEEITFTNADQMQIAADISLAYHLDANKVPAFYVKFRSDDLDGFTHGFLRNLARQKFDTAAGKYKIEAIMGDNAPFLKDVRDSLQLELDSIGVQLDQFGVIGAPRPPPAVQEAINAKVKATQDAQRVENELRQIQAQALKDAAQAEGTANAAIAKAKGEAQSNEIVTRSITPILLQWRQLDIQQNSIGKWNGVLPVYTAGNAIPLIQVPSK